MYLQDHLRKRRETIKTHKSISPEIAHPSRLESEIEEEEEVAATSIENIATSEKVGDKPSTAKNRYLES